MKRRFLWLTVLEVLLLVGCLPSGQTNKGGRTITVYGFSIMKEAFEIVVIRSDLSSKQPIIVTRPKTETLAFPLAVGQRVTAGLAKFRILPNFTLASERASKIVDTEK
jgi:hypothetical protein